MLEIPFTKMQGLGNNYLYIYMEEDQEYHWNHLAIAMSHPKFGIGSDGIVLIQPDYEVDCQMRIFNADGSEAEICGTALRCVGRYLYEKKHQKKKIFRIRTKAGIRTVLLHLQEQNVQDVTVGLGIPNFTSYQFPFTVPPKPIEVEGWTGLGVSMGNPHFVIFTDDVDTIDMSTEGYRLEYAREFPERSNIEWVQVKNEHSIKMRVWERGSQETFSCTSGACASVAAGLQLGKLKSPVTIELRGGFLKAYEKEEELWLTGPVEFICDGVYFWEE